MNILMTGPSQIDPGGVASYCNAILPFLNEFSNQNIKYMEVGNTPKKSRLLYPLIDQVMFNKQINENNPSIIHVNPSLNFKSFFRDGLIIYQAIAHKIPVLVFFHGWDDEFEKKIKGVYKCFFNQTYLKADNFVVLASQFKKQLQDWGVKAPIYLGTTTVPNDLISGFSITEKLSDVNSAEVIKVLFMARLEREKGVFETLDAIKNLLDKGYKVSLTIAGDGPVMEDVRIWLAAHHIPPEQIFLAGYVRGEDKRALLRSHHVYCFPTSYGEGMPISILEAMSFGMPVVTCSRGGIIDFFQDGKMGVLLDSPNVQAISSSIHQFICDKKHLMDVSEFNYQFACLNFRPSDIAKKLFGIYTNLDGSIESP